MRNPEATTTKGSTKIATIILATVGDNTWKLVAVRNLFWSKGMQTSKFAIRDKMVIKISRTVCMITVKKLLESFALYSIARIIS